eukprot:1467258-Pyramimonas_sp.AAC.1
MQPSNELIETSAAPHGKSGRRRSARNDAAGRLDAAGRHAYAPRHRNEAAVIVQMPTVASIG